MICLNCNFGYSKIIVRDFSYNFSSGGLFHIVGDNGIGKTTLLRGFSGIIKPLNGSIFSNDLNNIYYLPANGFEFFDFSSVEETIELLDLIFQDRLNDNIYFNKFILPLLDKKISELSDGQKQFLRLVPVFYESKKVILLDEPFNSIALEHVESILQLMVKLSGKIIIFTGHLRLNTELGINVINLERWCH